LEVFFAKSRHHQIPLGITEATLKPSGDIVKLMEWFMEWFREGARKPDQWINMQQAENVEWGKPIKKRCLMMGWMKNPENDPKAVLKLQNSSLKNRSKPL
jgi:hypothetical protein